MKPADTSPFSYAGFYTRIESWLDRNEKKDDIEFEIDDMDCVLSSQQSAIRCVVKTGFTLKLDFPRLETLLKIAAPSLLTFNGALCLDPADGRFCLVKSLKSPCSAGDVVAAIEMLVNQSSVWSDVMSQCSPSGAQKVTHFNAEWDAYRRLNYV